MSIEIVRKEITEQKTITSLSGKSVDTVCPSVVGKWAVIVKVDGFSGIGIDFDFETAKEKAIKEAVDIKNM